MIVKYLPDLNIDKEDDYCQIPFKEYIVYSVIFYIDTNKLLYNLYDDEHMEKLTAVDASLYQIIDKRIPPDWIFSLGNNNSIYILPKKISDACDNNFEEHYYNYQPHAEPILERVRNKNYELELEAQATFEEVTRDLELFHGIKPKPKNKNKTKAYQR